MADYDYLSVSNGSGDAALMHVQTERLTGSSTLDVDTVVNVPQKFIGTYGLLGPDGLITSATKKDFKGHLSGADVIIDGHLPGSTDTGTPAGYVVIIKPNTSWSDNVANFIKNLKNIGTGLEALWVGALTATSAAITAALTVGGDATVTGNLVVNGTSRVASGSVASGSTITPANQIYDVTALAANATIAVPSFAAQNGMSLILRIKDNGSARTLAFASGYKDVSGIGLPTTTVAGKELTIGAMYNSSNSKWEVQGINQEA